MIILVRHAAPLVDGERPPSEWSLGREGRTETERMCARLVREIGTRPNVVSSPEPKARQTVAPIGVSEVDACFAEATIAASDLPLYRRQKRREYVEGTEHDGWESHHDVVARFERGFQRHKHLADERPLVIASHGMAMTLWLRERYGIDKPGDFWQELRFPDAFRLDEDDFSRLFQDALNVAQVPIAPELSRTTHKWRHDRIAMPQALSKA
ncbi:histidine phosphatase family protein [Haloglycomyces albus]|uniref:histidine phosphatase family protein n=1 Tax=Haloglycomyces albus TaxID=526067 RepID=UPI00046D27B6|nr:histidine phosphatase family protein [Haloglycomyces albus]